LAETGVEVWRGGVTHWECDQMGHLNIIFYVAKSMEGLMGLAAELGMPQAFSPRADITLIVREQHIRFLREARTGAPLAMTAGVVEMSETEARLVLLMRHADGALAATFQTVVACCAAGDGLPVPWPDPVRARAEAFRAEVPAEAVARSIALQPPTTTASLQRAVDLGLHRTGLGAVRVGDCDVFGRMRAEQLISRVFEGSSHLAWARRLAAGEPQAANIGAAALEYRLAYFAWPKAGDRVELRSGWASVDSRVRRSVHWLLDPVTGRCWGGAEAVLAVFDTQTRKIVTLSPEAVAVAQAETIAGLTL
jgi:acyl-CoA thioester hydrolase